MGAWTLASLLFIAFCLGGLVAAEMYAHRARRLMQILGGWPRDPIITDATTPTRAEINAGHERCAADAPDIFGTGWVDECVLPVNHRTRWHQASNGLQWMARP